MLPQTSFYNVHLDHVNFEHLNLYFPVDGFSQEDCYFNKK